MHNKKSLLIIGAFGLITSFTLFMSFQEGGAVSSLKRKKIKPKVQVTQFKNLYFYKTKDSLPYFDLQASLLDIKGEEELLFISPKGTMFSKGKNFTYTAEKGVFLQRKKYLNLIGSVNVVEANNSYKSNLLSYDGMVSTITANGDVETVVKDLKTKDNLLLRSDTLVSYLDKETAVLRGNVSGKIKRRRRYERGLNFNAELVDINLLESRIKLHNTVKIHRDEFKISSQKAEIFLENFNKKLKYYSLSDDVELVERIKLSSGRFISRKAFAEKLEAFQSSGRIVLSGAPRVEQGDDVIKGYQITLREDVELVEVDDSQSSFSIKRKLNE